MLFDIVNMSDAYIMETKDLECAAVAVAILGGGQYALKEIEGKHEVPFFMFGGVDDWFVKTFGNDFVISMARCTEGEKRESMIATLESVMIGRNPADRKAYIDGLELIDDPAKKKEWRNRWHEERRSSMNNIGARAWELAEKLKEEKKQAANETLHDCPQQVFTA